jgi:hypothetical protein
MASGEAAKEFEAQYGTPSGNAEDIIKAAHARQTPELRQAGLAPLDLWATAALDLKKVEKEVEGTLHSAAVRGKFVVAVVEDAAGRLWKKVLDAEKIVTDTELEDVSDNEVAKVRGPKQNTRRTTPSESRSSALQAKRTADAEKKAEADRVASKPGDADKSSSKSE